MKLIPIILLCVTFHFQVFAQKLSSSDSLLIKKYWDKIQIYSTTSKSGNLYVNTNNYLNLKFPGNEAPPYKLVLRTNNGTVETLDNLFVTIPKFIGNAYIRVLAITPKQDTLLICKKKLSVLGIPEPSLIIGGTVISENSAVSRNAFLHGDTLKLFFTEDLPGSSQWYRIDYFNAGYTYGGAYFYEDNKGAFFSKKSLEIIRKQLPGQEFVIKVIAISPVPKHNFILPIVRFKLQ